MARKTFKTAINESPAASFITGAQTPEEGKELKTARFNLVIREKPRADLRKLAFMNKVSTNEMICRILEEYIEAHRDEVAAYDAFFEKMGKRNKQG